jgi:hypothetical protein
MTTQEFIAKLTPENVELISKMQAVKTPEEAYAVAKTEGVTDSFDQFVAGMTAFYNEVKDLSEDDLALVAGGLSGEEAAIISSVTAVATTVGTFVAASVVTLAASAI